ncbi:unnamed protein product [Hermetia illucens]|uniref:Uncharacterized protein n=1 Tax=Hermetia illucens TaxID=343691 RepID=A0A7R8YQ12_HERIL|nr:unnamed protein product [Hermetia illucens]
MTSGEWDLRALKALEEEEQAQFEAISEPARTQIPPPPALSKLPTIEEFCGIIESPPDSPLLPLPPSLNKPLKLSSICGAGSVISNSCPSSSSISSSLSREGSIRSHRKTHQRRSHQFPAGTGGKGLTTFGSDTAAIDSAIDSILSGGSGSTSSLVVGLGYGAETTSVVDRTKNNKDMMTMMMFLSSTAPPEVVSPTVSATTTSLLCTGKSDTASDDGSDTIRRTPSVTTRHPISKKSKCTKQSNVVNSSSNDGEASKSDVIDYELEDHIKHCSCSCNHMGYGNSMDYQVRFAYKLFCVMLFLQ